MGSLKTPKITEVAITTVPELLVSSVGLRTSPGMLKSGEVVEIGDPAAWDAGTGMWKEFNQGAGDVCEGFFRIPGDSSVAVVPVEVVISGGVRYSLIAAADNYHADILTDLFARYIEAEDGLYF